MRRRRILTLALSLLVLILAAAGLFAWRFPLFTGNLVLGSFRALPAGLRGSPTAWSVARQLLLWQYRDKMPEEVKKAKQGRFGREKEFLIVALGDSTTRGVQISAVNAWPFQLQQRITRSVRGGVRVVNAGIPGEPAPQGYRRLARDVLSLKPDLVIVGYLINDSRSFGVDATGRPRVLIEYDAYLAAFAKIFAALKEAGIPVLVFTCHPLQPAFFHGQPEEIQIVQNMMLAARLDGLRNLCQQWQVPLADTFAAIQADPDQADLYLRDGMHLNEVGHRRVAEWIQQKWLEIFWPAWRDRQPE